jgi:tetratricopeptide (TPR) repeat protein
MGLKNETLTVPGATDPWESVSASFPGERYRLVGEIARGGMGVVLRAQDLSVGRLLAVKLLLPAPGLGAADERRFLEEARITGQLQHPGIPPVHEVGRLADGRPFFSMKLIEGRTLAALLAERATPHTDLPRFLMIFEQIAQTLAYAHDQGVIHRDLKPSNIMVGAFGEVQVMDWGLAKRLQPDPTPAAPPSPAVVRAEPVALPEAPAAGLTAAFTLPATPQPDSDRLTQAGQVLGTPAFMSPEQARGVIESLDERSDVFGLGAILCVILTGAPPYLGTDRSSVYQCAARADLTDALQRLQLCGADRELAELCRLCLMPEAAERPAHAGVVADHISAYLASVQEALEQTRVERAAAVVQAREERKRRRLAVGLALAIVLLLVGVGGVGLWAARDQARRDADAAARAGYLEREVSTALGEAERRRRDLHEQLRDERQAARLLGDPNQWRRQVESAQEALKRAEVVAGGDRDLLSPELSRRLGTVAAGLEADEHDQRLAFELDRIRLESSVLVAGQVRLRPAAPRLAQVFQSAGYDIERQSPGEVAGRIRQSAIRRALVAGLDSWALSVDDRKLQGRLLEVARAADPDPWRDRFRQVEVWNDQRKLRALAAEVDCAQQSPQLLAALGQRFASQGGDATGFFRRALIHHPRDFWLSFEFGIGSKNSQEQAGAFRTAVAVRPDASVAHYNLGVIQQAEGHVDEALACYQNAVALDPKNAAALNNLGLLFNEQKKPAQAMACYRKAIASDPDSVSARLNLGGLLQAQGKLDEAVFWYHAALKIDPKSVAGLNNLGTALRLQNHLDEAIACFEKVIKLEPKHAMAWCNLGHALREQERFKEALPVFRKGHDLGSRQKGWSYASGFWILETQQWIALDEKLDALARGQALPGEARELLALAEFCVGPKKRYAAAARFYAAAFAAEPKLTDYLYSARRYKAACAAALAAGGEGRDAADLDPTERRQWRRQALVWLTAELKSWAARFETHPADKDVAKTLKRWQDDPDLAGVRDEKSLARLSSEEQTAWRTFWGDVQALRARAE